MAIPFGTVISVRHDLLTARKHRVEGARIPGDPLESVESMKSKQARIADGYSYLFKGERGSVSQP